MDTIYRGSAYGKEKTRTEYYIYTLKEAKLKGIKYTYWRDAAIGHYAITDDNWVVKLCKYKRYYLKNGKPSDYYVFPFKSFFDNKKFVLNYEDYRGTIYRFNGASNKNIQEYKLMSYVKHKNMPLMIEYYLKTADKDLAFKMAFPKKVVRSSIYKRFLNKLFNLKEVKSMIRESIQNQLEKAGLTPEGVLEKLNKAYNVAESTENVDGMLKCIDKYEEYLNMKSAEIDDGNALPQGSLDFISTTFNENNLLKESNPNGN